MRDLNYDLKRLQAARDDGSHATNGALVRTGPDGGHAAPSRLQGTPGDGTEAQARGGAGQGVEAPVALDRHDEEPHGAPAVVGGHIGRPGAVPSNGELGIANREYVTNEDKSVVLDPEKLALVEDEHVVMALCLEAEFGLRREEAIKFTRSRDDRGDRIRLKGSTTKGGRPREVPVRNEGQRRLLDEARRLGGGRRADPAGPRLRGRAAAALADQGAAADRRGGAQDHGARTGA
ncbi:MAG: integrase domain-containing protein [Gammaproteobacteria bacterium]|nr:integrase domain-containing protein [Gammaproteobacteria bacterium]